MAVPNVRGKIPTGLTLAEKIRQAGGTTALTLEEKIAQATAMTEARRKAEAEAEKPENLVADLERLDPETAARMDRAVASARSLGGRPLVSGMAARRMGEEGLKQQFAAMHGGRPEQQFAATQEGATMGSRILGHQAEKMVGEGQERFGLDQRLSRARSGLERGQTIHALAERLKDLAAKKGIELSESQAMRNAISAVLTMSEKLDLMKSSATPDDEPVAPYSEDYPGFRGF